MFPVVGALIGAAVGLLCLGLRIHRRARSGRRRAGAGRQRDPDRRAARGWPRRRRRRIWRRPRRSNRNWRSCATAGSAPMARMILLVSFAAKLSALAAIPDGYVVPGLIAAHALARGVLPAMSLNLPYARKDGLARNAGQPDAATAAIAGGPGAADRAVVAVVEQRAVAAALAARERARHRVAGAAADRRPDRRRARRRRTGRRRPRSLSCSPQGWRQTR